MIASSILADIVEEAAASERVLHLASYENRMSDTARQLMASDLGNRYHLGTHEDYDPERRCVGIADFSCRALPALYELEAAAHEAARGLFGAVHSEFRLVSGVHAMMSSIAVLCAPGQLVCSISPENGGHFATKTVTELLGRRFGYLPWLTEEHSIDLVAAEQRFAEDPPAVVFLDHGAPLFDLPVAGLRAIVPTATRIVYDASHTLGLIAGGCFQDPLAEGADVLQGNTHKTFPGPQKAMVHFADAECGRRYSELVSGGLVSSQHTHHSIALFVTMLEMERYAAPYSTAMLANAQAIGRALLAERFELVSRDGIFTTSHELLVSGGFGGSSADAVARLVASGISANGRIALSTDVLRVGVQEVTRLGMGPPEMRDIASLMRAALATDDARLVREEVELLRARFPHVLYSFDHDEALC